MLKVLLALTLLAPLATAGLPDLWPLEAKPASSQPVLPAAIPHALQPAALFQQLFGKILATKAGESPDWTKSLQLLIKNDSPDDPVAHGVAELARIWLARAQMREIEAVLRQFYRKNVRFPRQLSEIEGSLPPALRNDPWGKPWSYSSRPPSGMPKLVEQRFQLGPALYPGLEPLEASAGDRKHRLPQWQPALVQVGGQPALQLRGADGASATLQPGGKTGEYTLLYLGADWALLAGKDQLVALPLPK